MNVFELRERLVSEYEEYTRSFITVRDDRLRQAIEQELRGGLLWPEPIVQLNPAFEAGEWIDELADERILHEECRRIFRIKSQEDPEGRPLRLHRHQADAVKAARTGGSYVLTTGTGSGKSLAYLIPIVDRVLREGPGRGIRAIVVYPMNALANSQAGELEKFLHYGYPDGAGPVRFHRYTGQESDDERQAIIADPPDILLTNYVMLELILTRPRERPLVEAARDLRFLVLDELHTYRGRQGSDVALLVRRVREACRAERLQCVGTSATLAGAEDVADQRAEIARVASLVFGTSVSPESVIVETLRRATAPWDSADNALVVSLRSRVADPSHRPPDGYEGFVQDPLTRWIETTFGLQREPRSEQLVRARPLPLRGPDGAARQLATLTGVDEGRCVEALQETLLAGYGLLQPETGFPLFAFRLHQFFSRGDTVYASPEPADERHVTTQAQQFVPGDRSRVLLPLAFCRECGQDYYTVRRVQRQEHSLVAFEPRELFDTAAEGGHAIGYLYTSSYAPWPTEDEDMLDRLPDEWLDWRGGTIIVKRDRYDALPQPLRVAPDGSVSPSGAPFHFVPAPFRFCLRCGVSYVSRERRDFSKLNTLGSGGRASATTILVAEAIRRLRADASLPERARKLLSFTDNRQDASLQAGHFNDFIEVGLLRSGLYHAAADAGPDGISHEQLTQRVFAALALPLELYARDPQVRFAARQETDRALRDVLGYRLYRDLERGWRVTAPNLEQCGLLQIEYVSLDELCAAVDVWEGLHPVLAGVAPSERPLAAKTLLDFMRRELAIKVDYLSGPYQEQLRQRSNQHLADPWAIDEEERLEQAGIAYPRSRRTRAREYRGNVFISPRGGFARFLRRPATFASSQAHLTLDDIEQIIKDLLEALRKGGLVAVVDEPSNGEDVPGYQVMAAAMRWRAGDGTMPFHDPIRVATLPAEGLQTNRFFVDFYKTVAAEGKDLEAREHTAQVPPPEREQREAAFREGRLKVLFCSPTMELGVDIAELNVVNLRNVPPTPANYAQRSGRAGRSGQPALVFTYCATGSSHDQYFFRRPERMVAGQVRPPQLDLANEDLVRAHLHAVWLAESRQELGSSLAEVLEVEGDPPSLELRPSLRDAMADHTMRERARARCERILASIPGLEDADWCRPGWLDGVLDGALLAFDQASQRWRGLYRAALQTREAQNRIIGDASRSSEDRARAKRLRAEAETQLELLRADVYRDRPFQSDFYSYRYFASEGFLPGYSFPRLPISAYVPGRRGAAGKDEFLSRPRFLAISEFGPRSIIYHEGSRYLINRVLLPADRIDESGLVTYAAKQCSRCGYIHPLMGGPGPDLCERCGAPLGGTLDRLFRLQNVSTRRRDRINSDEEERLRQGFEIRTGISFPEENARPRARVAHPILNGEPLAKLIYSGAATLWRINLGWLRRANRDQHGFLLDTERGYWARNEQVADDPEDPMSPATQRVIPYVEDHRNALLFEPATPLTTQGMASLAAALKRAIQLVYQLEEQELAVEPLPAPDNRRLLLFYESAEGGAGVLRRLVAESESISQVVRAALEICHFDPATGQDLRRAPGAREECEAACYDCLMSYGNQPDHRLVDRHVIKDALLRLVEAKLETSPAPLSRKEHLERLLRQCQSELERQFLRFLDQRGLELPSQAQALLASCRARPDFLYGPVQAAVFVDGPVHNYPDVAVRDQQAADRLEDVGWSVIRFSQDEPSWAEVVSQWPSVFGNLP
jgi:superfamily II DNA/RNA helicase/very-short-patch-repair endonuclease